jgi:hypothetical protein
VGATPAHSCVCRAGRNGGVLRCPWARFPACTEYLTLGANRRREFTRRVGAGPAGRRVGAHLTKATQPQESFRCPVHGRTPLRGSLLTFDVCRLVSAPIYRAILLAGGLLIALPACCNAPLPLRCLARSPLRPSPSLLPRRALSRADTGRSTASASRSLLSSALTRPRSVDR